MAKPEEIHRLVVACWNVDHFGVFDIELPERAPLSHGVPEQKLPTSRTYIEAADTDWCSTQTRVDLLPSARRIGVRWRILARPRWLRQQGHRSLRVTTTPLGVVIGDVTSITHKACLSEQPFLLNFRQSRLHKKAVATDGLFVFSKPGAPSRLFRYVCFWHEADPRRSCKLPSIQDQDLNVLWLIICGYLLLINVVSFSMFAIDKSAAERGEWRIAETTLLFSAFIGGSAGAIAAQHFLRHKTRKQPFRTMLFAVIALQILAGSALFYTPSRQALFYCMFKGEITTSEAGRIVAWLGCQKR